MTAAVTRLLSEGGLSGARVEPLAGDASTRRYSRAVSDSGGSAVIMEVGEPLAGRTGSEPEPVPFLRWQEFYRELGLRVPDVLAVDRDRHREGAGRALVAWTEAWCRERRVRWLHVKTRGPSTPDEGYERTRHFYLAMGFETLFETLDLWGPRDAALILVKTIEP